MATAATDVIGTVDDLLIQILLLLPLKSLMRFKLVSKHWKSLITSPRFSLLRYPSPDPVAGLFIRARKSEFFYDYIPLNAKTNPTNKPPFRELEFPGNPFPGAPFPYDIQQSCNGLLLCISYMNFDGSFIKFPPHSCFVFNPTAKSFAKIPQPAFVTDDGGQWSMEGLHLAFNPIESPFYKIICVKRLLVRKTFQIEVYSSESGAWRVSGEPFGDEALFHYGVYWNGSIHWTDVRSVLLYFNLNNEEIGQVALPAAIQDADRGVAYFGESCGHLHIIVTMDKKYSLDIYEMKRDYSGWFVVYRVDMTMAVEYYPKLDDGDELGDLRDYYLGFVLCLVRAEEEKSSFLVLHGEGVVFRCNLHDNSFEDICGVKDDDDDDDCWVDGCVVVETKLQCDYDYRYEFKPGNGIAAPLAFEHVETLVGV